MDEIKRKDGEEAPVGEALHLFECGYAWTFAPSLSAAIEIFKTAHIEDTGEHDFEVSSVEQHPDDGEFTMMFAEGCAPEGLSLDVECECTPKELEEWMGCGCPAGDSPVTLPASEWAKMTGNIDFIEPGKIFREYDP